MKWVNADFLFAFIEKKKGLWIRDGGGGEGVAEDIKLIKTNPNFGKQIITSGTVTGCFRVKY